MAKTKTVDKEQTKAEELWGSKLAKPGWTSVPYVLLKYQAELGLGAGHLNLILQIMKHRWEADELPFPSIGALAQSMGVSPRTVQRWLSELEKRNYLKRHPRFVSSGGQRSNGYSANGLIEAAEQYADKEMAERKKKYDAKTKRKRGLRPGSEEE